MRTRNGKWQRMAVSYICESTEDGGGEEEEEREKLWEEREEFKACKETIRD